MTEPNRTEPTAPRNPTASRLTTGKPLPEMFEQQWNPLPFDVNATTVFGEGTRWSEIRPRR